MARGGKRPGAGRKKGFSAITAEESRKIIADLVIKDIAVHLEDLFGAPQDFEWAFVENELYILQSRNITTINNTAS